MKYYYLYGVTVESLGVAKALVERAFNTELQTRNRPDGQGIYFVRRYGDGEVIRLEENPNPFSLSKRLNTLTQREQFYRSDLYGIKVVLKIVTATAPQIERLLATIDDKLVLVEKSDFRTIARRRLQQGESVQQVVKATGLTLAEVERLATEVSGQH